MSNQRTKLSEIIQFSPKQLEATAVADTHKFTLYGGAAGGGKSYWLRWYSIRWLIKTYKETRIKGLVAGLFSEDYPTLKDRHVGKLEIEVPEWMGSVKEDKSFGLCVKLDDAFGGGVLVLRNLDDPGKYMSTEFALEAVDELTRNQKEVFQNLRARLRWPNLEGKVKFIAGTNPGQIGHAWVKELWIDRFFSKDEEEADQFAFVQAKAIDNPKISKDYLKSLASLDERKRRALLDGDWDLVEGQFFTEFNREKHVIPAMTREKMPQHWANFRSIDVSGRNGITSCHWYCLDGDGTVRAYREYYMTGKDADEHAREIWFMSHKEKPDLTYENDEGYKYTMMDSAAWFKMGLQESIAEIYQRVWNELDLKYQVESSNILVPTIKGKDSRVAGWDTVQEYLRWDDKHDPKLQIMDNCPNLIRTIPLAITDEKNNDDIDCFVAGTKVLTLSGEKNVEDIQVSELVVTPIGSRRVIKAGISGDSDKVCSVYLSDGRILRGTVNHKIMVINRGLVELQELNISDILMERTNSNIEYIWKIRQLFIKGLFILKDRVGLTMNLMEVLGKKGIRHYIDKFILIILALFQRVITFIIKITTTITTNLQILSLSQLTNTQFITTNLFLPIQLKKEKGMFGTGQKLGSNNYENKPKKCLPIHQNEASRAQIVEILLRLNALQGSIVKIVDGVRDFIQRNAIFVVKSSWLKKMVRERPKPVRILAVGNYESQRVYRLTVEDAHLYYANGILVTNTHGEDHALDDLRYMIQTLRDQKMPAVENAVQRKLREMKEVEQQETYNYSRA